VHLRIAEPTSALRTLRTVSLVTILALTPALLAAQEGGRKGNAKQGGDAKSDAKGDAKGGSKDGRGGGGGRTASVILAATDVYKVTRGKIEAGLPISGDLRPIETVSVRTRVDGILEKVTVREGQTVTQGQLLAKFESAEQEAALASAEADRLATKSDYETQQWSYEQNVALFKAGAIAERDMRTSQQAAEAAKARLAASDARLRTAQNVVRDTKVVAPVNGIINTRKVQNGEQTLRGSELFTIVRNETLELTASLPAKLAGQVKSGQLVRFSADGKQFTGNVARVSPTVDPTSRNVTVYIQIPNRGNALKGNTFASGQIIARTVNDAFVVPQAAVRISPVDGKTMVYKVEGGVLNPATVKTGISDDARSVVEILEGVQEKDVVVVGNPGTLGRGMKATVLGNDTKSGGGRGGKGEGRGGKGASAEGGKDDAAASGEPGAARGGRGGRGGKKGEGMKGEGTSGEGKSGDGAPSSERKKKGAP
jgi:membrane fusion protein (multidrug efflux system)